VTSYLVGWLITASTSPGMTNHLQRKGVVRLFIYLLSNRTRSAR